DDVVSLAGGLDDDVAVVIDDVGVVTVAAGHFVAAGAAVEGVVAAAAGQLVVAAAAGQAVVAGIGEDAGAAVGRGGDHVIIGGADDEVLETELRRQHRAGAEVLVEDEDRLDADPQPGERVAGDLDLVQPLHRRDIRRRAAVEGPERDGAVDRGDVGEGVAGDDEVRDAVGTPGIRDRQPAMLAAVGGERVVDDLERVAGDDRVLDPVERNALSVEDVVLDEDGVEARHVEVAAAGGLRVDYFHRGGLAVVLWRHVPLCAEPAAGAGGGAAQDDTVQHHP